MATFNTMLEMQIAMEGQLSVAIDNTTTRLLETLQSIIMNDVYNVGSPSDSPWGMSLNGEFGKTTGNRTGQFYDSWQTVKSTIVGNMIVGEINQAMEIMEQFLVSSDTVHTDRENLAQILNTGNGYNFGQMEGVARPYWDEFVLYVEQNIKIIFYEECKKVGLPITINAFIV